MAKRMSSPSTSSSGWTGGITTASLIQRESRHTSRRHRVELDVHAVIGKFHAPALCSLQDPRAHRQRYTRVNPFEITADTARDFADRQRPGTVMARTISTRLGASTAKARSCSRMRSGPHLTFCCPRAVARMRCVSSLCVSMPRITDRMAISVRSHRAKNPTAAAPVHETHKVFCRARCRNAPGKRPSPHRTVGIYELPHLSRYHGWRPTVSERRSAASSRKSWCPRCRHCLAASLAPHTRKCLEASRYA
jgi:hypothetical protein